MPNPSRAEVWLVDLNPTRGHKQAGRRPGLVVSVDPFNHGPVGLVVVLPITTRAKDVPFHVSIDPPEAGLKARSFIKCEDRSERGEGAPRPAAWRHLGGHHGCGRGPTSDSTRVVGKPDWRRTGRAAPEQDGWRTFSKVGSRLGRLIAPTPTCYPVSQVSRLSEPQALACTDVRAG